MLEPGTPAPGFTLPDQNGESASLADADGPVVLYFYPRADTEGCTAEACGFRDNWDAFEAAGVTVFGVSNDDTDALRAFHEKYDLPHRLLSDPDGEVASAYESYGTVEIRGETAEIALRNTYVIDDDGVIRHVFEEVSPEEHAAEILERLG